MQKNFNDVELHIRLENEDREFIKKYCADQNKSVSMYFRNHIKRLRYGQEAKEYENAVS